MPCEIRAAAEPDCALILTFIRELAEYEKLAHEVIATEAGVREALFGSRPAAEAVLAFVGGEPVGFALYFQTFSTFVGRPGLYLEDLYVRPQWRGRGCGRRLLAHLAKICIDRKYGRMEWAVLNWNEPAIAVYQRIGAVPMTEWTVQRLTGESLRQLAAGA
jgi:GNAT superfamily N-acetyltransferase